ncbi:contact-dependent growth inhibition system immunity protein [Nocardioides sp. SYSU D00065]|uniref:contact-dependent growth inhibition system immunity protein n=1 Tax=Nocardioides sp. SYSU D00065 TaxID=2817378 RepID=UPI0027DAE8A4|nr:contact-dependent growth inhibition system immunity protein [Nocardioides sp. SYSU D00065]
MDDLRHLMAAYFHQDWSAEYDGSWQAAVADYARRSPDRVPGLLADITRLLEQSETDDDVASTLDGMGNYRSPGDSPTAHVDWLREIHAQARALM